MHRSCWLRLIFLSMLAISSAGTLRAEETALDRYVKKPDPTYAWRVVRERKVDGATQFVVDLKSQTWRTEKDVNQPVWQHWVTIVKPDRPASKTAFLFISGGANGGDPPASAEDRTIQIARATNTVAVELRMVPNQPLIFHGDGKPRKEDDLIAYTWDQFLKTGDETWPARLPMVKSVVRAMDCVQELLASEQGGRDADREVRRRRRLEARLDHLVHRRGRQAGGGHRADRDRRAQRERLDAAPRRRLRLLLAGDQRLRAAQDHAAGMHDPRLTQLYEIEDPYSYRAAADDAQADRQRHGRRVLLSRLLAVLLRRPAAARSTCATSPTATTRCATPTPWRASWPSTRWSWPARRGRSTPGRSRRTARSACKPQTPPKQVNLWQATNPDARDFRVATIGKAYTSRPLEPSRTRASTSARIEPPDERLDGLLRRARLRRRRAVPAQADHRRARAPRKAPLPRPRPRHRAA